MADPRLQSKLPVPESFDAEYLEYYRMPPLELTAGRLLVAVAMVYDVAGSLKKTITRRGDLELRRVNSNQVAFETDSAGSLGLRYTWGLGTDDLVGVRDFACPSPAGTWVYLHRLLRRAGQAGQRAGAGEAGRRLVDEPDLHALWRTAQSGYDDRGPGCAAALRVDRAGSGRGFIDNNNDGRHDFDQSWDYAWGLQRFLSNGGTVDQYRAIDL